MKAVVLAWLVGAAAVFAAPCHANGAEGCCPGRLYVAEIQPEGWGLTFEFLCETSHTYTLQASTDLKGWVDVCYVSNVEKTNRIGYLSDLYWLEHPTRLYRLKIGVLAASK